MQKVAVAGVGMTKFGCSQKSQVEMFAEAAMDALVGSNLEPKDVQALFVGNVMGDFTEGQLNIAAFCASELGLSVNAPAVRVEGACASASVAIREAYNWIASGVYDIILVGGTERCLTMDTSLATRTFAMGSDSRYEVFNGLTFPGVFGMAAHLYSDKYQVPLSTLSEAMARVAVKNHKNGAKNPLAQFQKEISVETVQKSAMIADPLRLFDCCPFSDGAAAIVLASEKVIHKLTDKPVYILGVGQAHGGPLYRQKDITRIRAREASAAQAYEMAGLTPGDMDVCELHDCFTIAEILAVEGLGFYTPGKGYTSVMNNETGLDGKIAVNPSGGLKAKGHPIGATGAAQAFEIVNQLRGECGERQVKGAKRGITDTLGGDLGTIVNIIYGV